MSADDVPHGAEKAIGWGADPIADITPAPHFDPPPEVAARVQALRDLATRWEATPPAHHARDGFTAAQAPTMLRRLAAKLASPDPAVAALGAEQLRGVGIGWHDKGSPAALLWGEAVALLPGDAPTVAPAESPAHPLALVMAQAYERGRAKGREEERETFRDALDALKYIAGKRDAVDHLDGDLAAMHLASDLVDMAQKAIAGLEAK